MSKGGFIILLGVWVTRQALEESILNISLNSSSFPVCETKSGKFRFLLHTYPITGMLGWFLYSVGSKITTICITTICNDSQRFATNHNDLQRITTICICRFTPPSTCYPRLFQNIREFGAKKCFRDHWTSNTIQ